MNFVATGENFALMSGTSMAAPHVAGLAALVKQKFPNFSPAAIGSALSTSASLYDNNGRSIMAQRSYPNVDLNLSPATPFDMGSGFVNATAALNPGLLFDSSKSHLTNELLNHHNVHAGSNASKTQLQLLFNISLS